MFRSELYRRIVAHCAKARCKDNKFILQCGLTDWLRALAALLFVTAALPGSAAVLVQDFYMPMPEGQIYQAYSVIESGITNIIDSAFSAVVTGDGTIVYYDQWEDGYEIDLTHPTQSTTQVWGDGNDNNGIPPGFAHDPQGLPAGTVLTLRNNVSLPRNPATILFDARDHMGATKALAVSRVAWPTKPGSVMAGAVEVPAVMDYGTNYISPVGQDMTNKLFQYCGLFVMAANDATSVTIDVDGSGPSAPSSILLNRGESYLINGGVKRGGHITSSKPVQVSMITGHVQAHYAADWFTLRPVEDWSSTYYTPVGTSSNGNPAYVYLYNSTASALSINYATVSGSGSFNVPSNSTFQFTMPKNSGARFTSAGGQKFFAICTAGANPSSDAAYNWGFSLLPGDSLTTEAVVGWGPGSSDGTKNGSPVWVTVPSATRVYVDYNGDHNGPLTDPNGKNYDVAYDIAALSSKTIYDPDKNQTGMRLYTVDGTAISAVWGEDPAVAGSGNPYIDAGTAVLPFPVPVLIKSSIIVTDAPPAGLSLGDTIEYTIELDNKGLLPLGDTVIVDAPPPNLAYVPNSTSINGNAIPDDVSGTPFPIDGTGYTIPIILKNGTSFIKYRSLVVITGTISNYVNAVGYGVSAQHTINIAPPSGSLQCALSFSDSIGTATSAYNAGTPVYVTLSDNDANTASNSVQSISVIVTNITRGDFETITLVETGNNTGVFRNAAGLPSATSAGASTLDGILNVQPGDLLAVNYRDPLFADACSASANVQPPLQTKVLYLSTDGVGSPDQDLDRIDPVASNDNTTSQTADVGAVVSSSGTLGVASTSSTNSPAATNSVTFSHTSGSGTNSLLVIGVSMGVAANIGSITVTNVTYGGVTLSNLVAHVNNGTAKARTEIWYLTNPPAGPANVVIRSSAPANLIAGAITFTNANLQFPFGAVATAHSTSSGTSASLNVVSATNEIPFVSIDVDGNGSAFTLVNGAAQNALWNTNSAGETAGAASTKAGVASASFSWTWTGGQEWAVAGVSVKPATTSVTAAGTNSLTFAQTPAFCQNFDLPAGGIVAITNYIGITSGAMPANPAITAYLQSNGSNFAVLTAPVYNALNGTLTWSGVLSSNVHIPVGQAISFVLSNAQSGVSYNVQYDSASRPSQILLPTTTVISVAGLGVYDAPYPGGSLVSTPPNGSVLYVRVNATDPFGSYDISSVSLAIDGPGTQDDLSVSLTNANLVASDSCSRTYEYVWQTGSTPGTFDIAATANEGTEGITASSGATVTLEPLDTGTPSAAAFTSGNNGPVTNAFSPNGSICIRVSDLDQNLDSSAVEPLTAIVTSSTGDSESVTLTETGTNSGVFAACVSSSASSGAGTNNGVLNAPAGSVITLSYTDPNDPTDQSTATATILPPAGVASLSVTKTLISPANGQAGSGTPVSFNLQVVNTGNTNLPVVTVTDIYPSTNLSFVSASITPDVVSAGNLTWTNVGPLGIGQSTNITVNFTATGSSASAVNIANVSGGGATNSSPAGVTITHSGVAITKTLVSPTNGSLLIGSNAVFHIVVQNSGDTAIANLPLEDTFSGTCFQFVTASITPDATGAGSLLWNDLTGAGNLAPGGSIGIDITMKAVGGCDPANNTAHADFVTDVNGNPVPPSSSTVGLPTAASQINGFVYNDPDQSGTLTPGDSGLTEVSLTLYSDPNGDGDPSDGAVVNVTTTDSGGYYELLNLSTGAYVVVETDLPGYASTAPADNRRTIIITSLSTNSGYNFFDYQPNPIVYGRINGTVWSDTNANGVVDPGEPGLANVTIDLVQDLNTNGFADVGEPLASSTLTDSSGGYSFAGVIPGRYVVRENDLFGYLSTADAQAPNDNQVALNITSGLVTNGIDFLDYFTGNNPGNDAPVAANDSYSTSEDTVLNVNAPGVLNNDTDVDGDALSAILVVGPAHGTLNLNTNGSFSYSPAPNYFGSDSFTYRAFDGTTNSGIATVFLSVNSVNDAPVAADDSYAIGKNGTLAVSAPGVLSNDLDIDGDALVSLKISNPAHGALTFNANGSFTYTPASNYFGADSFTYQASDGLATSAVATVTLNITNVNRAPVALPDSYTGGKNAALTIVPPGVLGNDFDLDGDTINASKVTDPAHGTVTLNVNGGFIYTPVSNYFGSDAFAYLATDGVANSSNVTVTLTITNLNRAPTATDDSYSVGKNGSLNITAPGVLGNDSDLDADVLASLKVSDPTHGTLTLNANGSFVYTPASNYFGADSFTYQASDGTASSTVATVSLSISNINRAPVANDDAYTVLKNSTLTISVAGVLGNDIDLDGDALLALKATDPAHGSLTFNADGSFTYMPTSNYFGADSFTYRATDSTVTSLVATVTFNIANSNSVPVAVADAFTLGKNTTLSLTAPGVLANDIDGDGDTLTATKVADPTHGSVTLNADGSFNYTPASNYFGADSFTYRASDGLTNSATVTVSLTITNLNRAPTAANDAYTFGKNSSLNITAPGLLANDLDLDGDLITSLKVTDPAHGTVTVNTNGSFTYTPVSNYFGADSFTYLATDGASNSAPATVSLTITNINRAPTAGNDAYTLGKNGTLNLTAPGILANDSDLDGDSLTANKVTDPAHGSVTLNTDGSFTYTPASNYFGADNFTYRASDGLTNSATATVSLTITNINRGPTAANDAYTLGKNSSLNITAPGLLANDVDLDGDLITSLKVTDPTHGTVTVSTNGSFTYTPVSNYFGADSFTYLATDGASNSAPATVALTITNINRAPTAGNDAYTLGKNGTLNLTAPGILANDSDLDGDSLTANKVTDPAHGSLTLNTDGGFTYTPVSNYFGADSYTYQASDGTASSTVATVSLTITNINRAPVANDDAYALVKNGTLTVSAAGVLANDIDLDGDALSALKVTDPAHGSLTLNGNGSFTYTPASNYFGADTFTYRASDTTATSLVATVTLTIGNSNTPPVAAADAYTFGKNGTLSVSAPGVLGNDLDSDGDTLTAAKIADPTHGSVTLNSDGSFVYTPVSNYFGADSFTYRTGDGLTNSATVTVSLTITNINRAPTAANDAYTFGKNSSLNITAPGLLSNDLDLDGDLITSLKVTDPAHGTVTVSTNGSFTYTPVSNYFGADSFTYLATDGANNSSPATVSLTITNVNRAPTAAPDAYTLGKNTALSITAPGLLTNDLDLDGDLITALKVTDPAHGTVTVSIAGSFTYTPVSNYFGADSFSYLATDGASNSAPAIVSLTITNINRAPTAGNDTYTLGKNGTLNLTAPGVLANDSDLDGDALSVNKVTDPAHGSLTLNTDGSFTYTPVSNYFGADSFTYQASDGTASSTVATVSLSITNINRAPVANDDAYTVLKNSTLTISPAGVLGNDLDLDGDALLALKATDPAHGSLTLNANGSFIYTPTSNYFGADTFTYRATDSTATSLVATVTLNIANSNSVPVAVADAFTLGKNTTLSLTAPGVLANDIDGDGDTLTATKVADPTHGSVTLNADGSFNYTPASNYFGADSFTYRASDGLTNSATVTVSLTITNINRAPTATPDAYTLGKNTALSITAPGLLANDLDLDGDLITSLKVTDPAHGTVTVNTNGSFTYTPVSNYFGADSFTYLATDGASNSSPATVSLTITNINRAPTGLNDAYTLAKSSTLTVAAPGVLANDTDLDGDALTGIKVANPAHGSVTLNGTGGFTYTPVSNYFGADSFTYRATDGVATSAVLTVTLAITNFNHAPIAVADLFTNLQNTALTVAFTNLLSNDLDQDGDALSVTFVSTNTTQAGKIKLTSTNLTYTPFTNFTGTDTFTYVISDGQGGTGTGTVTVVVLLPEFGVLAGNAVLNPQTGLFEQNVTITNLGASTVAAVRLCVSGLRTNVTLYNAEGIDTGLPYVQYNAPLDPGARVTLALEFYVPDRKPLTNTFIVKSVSPDVTGTNAEVGVPISRSFVDNRINGSPRFVIEFASIPGRTYTIFYSSDLVSWFAATPSITASTTSTQWYDDGPPKTLSKPLSNTARYYRVLVAPVNP
jgi:uncharacterized repeat protein (TIGR01451 family)